MKDRAPWRGALKKEIWVLRASLFWGNCEELPLIFYTKKKKKITITCLKIPQMLLIDYGNTITSW